MTPVDLTIDGGALPVALVAAAFFLGLILGTLYLFAWAILRAADKPAPIALTVSLSMLTFLAIVGAITTSSAAIETVAAAGLGALASAVSQQFQKRRDDE